ncbi:hypothetical protein M422DRAFT_24649 [Sphaerobolus stellatus SS14]|nr:hypothetical protein M422DRAFT_24649 [Sphaerobolus stellatus SS14]
MKLSSRFIQTRAFSTDETRTRCIALMRATAQPVSVATTILPRSSEDTTAPEYHGATLSSFTSVAMYPYPIISFALRTPSRMADILRRHSQTKLCPPTPHLVINLLGSSMAHTAVHFSRPREDPFGSTAYFLSQEKIPILQDSLGALTCSLIRSIPLGEPEDGVTHAPDKLEGQGSELFLARVLRVEPGQPPGSQNGTENLLPLLYHHQRYGTIDLTNSVSFEEALQLDNGKNKN